LIPLDKDGRRRWRNAAYDPDATGAFFLGSGRGSLKADGATTTFFTADFGFFASRPAFF
jgi:hypothetical protein